MSNGTLIGIIVAIAGIVIGPLLTAAVAVGTMKRSERAFEQQLDDLKIYIKERCDRTENSLANFGKRIGDQRQEFGERLVAVETRLGVIKRRPTQPGAPSVIINDGSSEDEAD